MVWSPQDPCGSCSKADAPPPPEFRVYLGIRTVGDHRLVVASIIRVATKTFPCDVGDVSSLEALRDTVKQSPDTLVSALIEAGFGRRIAEIRQDSKPCSSPMISPNVLAFPVERLDCTSSAAKWTVVARASKFP